MPLPAGGSHPGTARMLRCWNDVTEKKSMHAALQSAQRMEAIGMLAGGIAHDFNNLLTAISGNISLALEQMAAGETQGRAFTAHHRVRSDFLGQGCWSGKLPRAMCARTSRLVQSIRPARELRRNDVRVLLKHSISPAHPGGTPAAG